MKAKKILSVLMVLAMTVSLAACGTTTVEPTDTTESTTVTTGDVTTEDGTTEDATTEASVSGMELTDEEITLKFWDIWPEGQPMAPIIKDYIAQYETAHPNIHIEEVATQEV
ncbi:MAG: hypothetical protein WBI07_13060, partial [Mobilitalea sp.]